LVSVDLFVDAFVGLVKIKFSNLKMKENKNKKK